MSLPSSMADFVPCDRLLQKAYYSNRLQNSRIFCERERRTIFERKAGASEKTARENGERVRLARFTLEDHAYGASRLPKTTVLQSNYSNSTQLFVHSRSLVLCLSVVLATINKMYMYNCFPGHDLYGSGQEYMEYCWIFLRCMFITAELIPAKLETRS